MFKISRLHVFIATSLGVGVLIGFLIGRYVKPRVVYIKKEKEKVVVKYAEETAENRIIRCGFIPENFRTNQDHFSVVSGPDWSPDCRYIAWGFWQSGTSWLGDDTQVVWERKLDQREGLYLYNDRTGRTRKIYAPKELDESVTFNTWVDSGSIEFAAKRIGYVYDIASGKISIQENGY